MKKRKITPQISNQLNSKEVVVITGMRQVGKTTLLKHLFDQVRSDNKLYLDLENPLYRKIFEKENYDAIWDDLTPLGINQIDRAYLFLDEIQNAPNLPKIVKYLFDHYQTKFFLTGSSSFYLKNLFSESLSSRKLIYELFPLDFGEFLTFKGLRQNFTTTKHSFKKLVKNKNKIQYQRLIKAYDEYMRFGGFPAVVLAPDRETKENLLNQVFKSYFEIDVKNLADFKDLSKLRDLILLLVPRVGSKLDITKLANELRLTRPTIYAYLEFLEQTYLIKLLPKFSSVDRQKAGKKKLFFNDSGLANYLGQLSQGALFEQSVFQNLHSQHQLSYFYKNKAEIDFIVDEKHALEVKLSHTKQYEYNLKRRFKTLDKLSNYYLVTNNYHQSQRVILATDL
ncbi:MAG: ATP-binding protein [Patescibacteria group bacterium]|nr:ATP-binding protein [Patescibacteria group bacterium]